MTVVQTKARVFSDATGAWTDLPILLSAEGPVLPLLDYLLIRSQERSLSWMRKVVQAVQLLLRFIDANEGDFLNFPHLLRAFGQRLYSGTVGKDGIDPSGLYWMPKRSRTIHILLAGLGDYCQWLIDHHDVSLPGLNRYENLSRYDERMLRAAWEYKRSRTSLGYTWALLPPSRLTTRPSWQPRHHAAPKVAHVDDGVSFPEARFTNLLLHGFVRRGYSHHPDPSIRLNLRDSLITLLMHGAGLRLSECFHLYVHDVKPDPRDPSVAQVRIHHPSEGDAPNDWMDEQSRPMNGNRSAYLAARYARRPRHLLLGTAAAGWKEPMLDGRYYMQAFWFPVELGRLFMHLWLLYLRQLAQIAGHHPYAFVVLNGPTTGELLSMDSFTQSHARAIERIGLRLGKTHGTTPHAHRHAYGGRLMRAGVEPVFRKKALHHKSLPSQAVYTAPTIVDMTRTLDTAMDRLNDLEGQGRTVKPVMDLSQLTQFGFEDVDPDNLLSGAYPRLLKGREK